MKKLLFITILLISANFVKGQDKLSNQKFCSPNTSSSNNENSHLYTLKVDVSANKSEKLKKEIQNIFGNPTSSINGNNEWIKEDIYTMKLQTDNVSILFHHCKANADLETKIKKLDDRIKSILGTSNSSQSLK